MSAMAVLAAINRNPKPSAKPPKGEVDAPNPILWEKP